MSIFFFFKLSFQHLCLFLNVSSYLTLCCCVFVLLSFAFSILISKRKRKIGRFYSSISLTMRYSNKATNVFSTVGFAFNLNSLL